MISAWWCMVSFYLGFAFATKASHIWILFFVYGLFFGLSEGPRELGRRPREESKRGTAYGAYYFFVGLAALPASLLMGLFGKR